MHPVDLFIDGLAVLSPVFVYFH